MINRKCRNDPSTVGSAEAYGKAYDPEAYGKGVRGEVTLTFEFFDQNHVHTGLAIDGDPPLLVNCA